MLLPAPFYALTESLIECGTRRRADRRTVPDGGIARSRRPLGGQVRPCAVVGITVEVALRVTRNAWHLVGLDALCVICILPEPVLVPAPLYDRMRIVVS